MRNASKALSIPLLLGVLATLTTGLLGVEPFEITEGSAYGYPLPWTGEVGFHEPVRTVYNWTTFFVDVLSYGAIGYGLIFLVIFSRSAR